MAHDFSPATPVEQAGLLLSEHASDERKDTTNHQVVALDGSERWTSRWIATIRQLGAQRKLCPS